jgi:hypothetical protein
MQSVLSRRAQTQAVVTLGRTHSISNSRLAARSAVFPAKEGIKRNVRPSPSRLSLLLSAVPEPWLPSSLGALPQVSTLSRMPLSSVIWKNYLKIQMPFCLHLVFFSQRETYNVLCLLSASHANRC